MTAPLLTVSGLTAGFGTHQVLHGVDLHVKPGEVVGIFGLNGAGKSVTMKVLAGIVPAWSGSITFDGTDITGAPAEQRVAAGISNVPQGRQVFPDLTVEENLRLGAYTLRRRARPRYGPNLAHVYASFPILAQRRFQLAGSLSGGEQAALAVGRALINEPRLILVDEPSAGLAPLIVEQLGEILQTVAGSGVAMILVEQNVSFGLSLVDRANIMQTGRVVHEAPVNELDHETLAAQLGIGRMLTSTTAAALAGRTDGTAAPAPPRAKPKRKAPAKRKPTQKKAAAKKAAKKKPAAKRAAPKKRAPRKGSS